MSNIENELNKKYGLKRSDPVGKKMGDDLYFHKCYSGKIIGEKIDLFLNHIPNDFNYDVVKYNKKKRTVSFISCPDFNHHDEPIVKDSFTVDLSDKFPKVYQTKASKENPFVYHHKWMFVNKDYSGFNVLTSMLRSIKWKNTMQNNNEKLSNVIGRLNTWLEWCQKNNIENSYSNDCFKIFYDNDHKNILTSASTSVRQIPKVFSLLDKYHNSDLKEKTIFDIGCGKYPEPIKEKVESMNGKYLFADPFNQEQSVNIKNIEQARDGKSDIVSLCNVLNTIKIPEYEKSILNLLEQAKNCLKKDGHLIISIYKGELTKDEKKKKQEAIERGETYKPKGKYTKGGSSYQNRMEPEEYLPYIQKVFGFNSKIINKGGIIILSQDPKVDLTQIYNGGKIIQDTSKSRKIKKVKND